MNEEQAQELAELRATVAQLTERVSDLEWALDRVTVQPRTTAAPTPAPAPHVPVQPQAQPASPAPRPAPPTAQPAARPAPPPRPPRPPRPAFDWGRLAEQMFAARTLAWAGGVATVLGIVLLFVMAASRGWITPSMRVGMGVIVSVGMLAAALEFDRRTWRSDAILAAAGVGIAGLYASLWAATSLYHLVSSAAAAPLAACVAGIAVAVGIRVKQEPLAVFGMSGAMLAPVLVSEDVTAGGVFFSAVMVAAAAPLVIRLGWEYLLLAVWLIGFGETAAMLLRYGRHAGFGAPVAAATVMAALFVVYALLIELLPRTRARLTTVGSLVIASAFTVSLGTAFLFAGGRQFHGHSLAGITLAGVGLIWAALAAVPYAVRRPHADLTDGLIGFGLTNAAIATGLLAGGPALPCAWSAESALLVLLAERIRRRSGARRLRSLTASGIYLSLAVVAAGRVLTIDGLPHIGAGATGGSIALAAVALAGIVFCFGLRGVARPELPAAWLVPAGALAFLPAWALPAGWAVIAYAGMAAALFGYRRTRVLVAWLPEWVGLLAGSGWWLIGLGIALAVTAPGEGLEHWSGLGARHGLPGLAALVAAGLVFAWSARRPARRFTEYGLLAPAAALAYLLAEALRVPYTMWAWLIAAGLIAAAVQSRAVRERAGLEPVLACAGGLLALGLVSAWAHDGSLHAIARHGVTRGWESIAIGIAAAFLFAVGTRNPVRRTDAMWVPFLLSGQLAAMLLPGQYPLVAAAGLTAAISAIVVWWPEILAGRLSRPGLAALPAVGAGGLAFAVLTAYETPSMLFGTSHTPASGLAAALATTVAVLATGAAVRMLPWKLGRIPGGTLLLAAGSAFSLWTLAAGILGAEQLLANAADPSSVHDHFQQGHVLVSVSWVLVGLALVVASLRSRRRELRIAGISLLFVALGKLFLYDLAFLAAMARAVSFIATGSVLLLAALLLQRYTQGKGVGNGPPEVPA